MRIQRALLGTTAILATTLTLAACSSAPANDVGTAPSSTSPSSSAAEFNDADAMFAQMMLPHHAQAVEMSETLLAKDGISAGTTSLAQGIIAAQKPEIEQLNGFLDEWGVEATDGMGHAMSGMMSEDDMNALDSADGAEAERLFLSQMTEHHRGAIEMATTEVSDGSNAAAITLAEEIASSQMTEIDRMTELLAAL